MVPESEIKDFYQKYRDSLSTQYQTALQSLEQQRKNDYASIMAGANKSGMLYSNFPQRSKMQYETGTYIPNMVKINSTYQTGLDALRSNILKYQNSIKDVQDAINTLNKTYTSS